MRTFLGAPAGLSDAVKLGPVRRQSDWLLQMLRDPKRSRVHLVTLAEEMPVTETLETSEELRGRLRMSQGAVFANAVYQEVFTRPEEQDLEATPDTALYRRIQEAARGAGIDLDVEDVEELLGYARFLSARRSIQARHLKALRTGSSEPVVELPFLFAAGLALPDLENLADEIEEGIEKL
jgi:hypothetical protein